MVNIPIPSEPCKVATNLSVRVPIPVHLAPVECKSLSEALVDFEAYLLDESGMQAAYAGLQELMDLQLDAEFAEQIRLQKAAALAEEMRCQAGTVLAAAARRVQDKAEMARSGWRSEEDSELDSKSSSPSPSSSSCSSSGSEAMPSRPILMKTKTGKAPRKQQKPRAKPYDRPTPTTSPPPRQEFVDFFRQNAAGTKKAIGENQYWVHSIDWDNAPLVWDGVVVPCMAADEVAPWLNENFNVFRSAGDGMCKFDVCPAARGRYHGTSLKSHILSSMHLNVRRKCHLCRFAERHDMFESRHRCGWQKAKNVAIIRADPDWPMPSYTWPEPSKA